MTTTLQEKDTGLKDPAPDLPKLRVEQMRCAGGGDVTALESTTRLSL
jgi:hypothetical protein